MCTVPNDQPPPIDFASPAGSGCILQVWKRTSHVAQLVLMNERPTGERVARRAHVLALVMCISHRWNSSPVRPDTRPCTPDCRNGLTDSGWPTNWNRKNAPCSTRPSARPTTPRPRTPRGATRGWPCWPGRSSALTCPPTTISPIRARPARASVSPKSGCRHWIPPLLRSCCARPRCGPRPRSTTMPPMPRSSTGACGVIAWGKSRPARK